MQAVLRDFVDAAQGWLDALAVKMVEGDASLADRVGLFNGLHYISF